MNALKQFWARLAPREQYLVAGGAVLLALVVLVFYVWQPLEKERQRLRGSLPGLRGEAQQIHLAVDEVARLKKVPKPVVAAAGLREMVDQSAGAHGIQLGETVMENAGKLSITLASVPFDKWVKWLGELQTQHAVRLESARIEALPQAGMVKVQAMLAKG